MRLLPGAAGCCPRRWPPRTGTLPGRGGWRSGRRPGCRGPPRHGLVLLRRLGMALPERAAPVPGRCRSVALLNPRGGRRQAHCRQAQSSAAALTQLLPPPVALAPWRRSGAVDQSSYAQGWRCGWKWAPPHPPMPGAVQPTALPRRQPDRHCRQAPAAGGPQETAVERATPARHHHRRQWPPSCHGRQQRGCGRPVRGVGR